MTRAKSAIVLTVFALALGSSALHGAIPAENIDPKAPHRVAVERLQLTGNPVAIGACVTRAWSRQGRVTSYALPDGAGVDYAISSLLAIGGPNASLVTLEFHRDVEGAYARLLYRHPYREAVALKVARAAARVCFSDDWNRWAKDHGQKMV